MYFILLKLHVNPSEMPDFALKWIMQDGDDTCQCVLDEIQKAHNTEVYKHASENLTIKTISLYFVS